MPAADSEGQLYPRVARLHSEDGGLTASTIESIADFYGVNQAASHQISNVSIGPDGKLYVHVGDANQYQFAQNKDSLLGKILRLELDGSPAVDNPFYDAEDGIGPADYIFAFGFRNPFGGAWRAADGQHYEIENGPDLDRLAQVVAGRNYNWNGTNESMMTYAICTFPGGTAPVNIAFVQSETFDGSGFPESKLGHVFVSESGPTWSSGTPLHGKRIGEVGLTAEGTLDSGPTPLIEYNGTGKATVVGIAAGPDGLYFTGLYRDYGYTTPFDRGADIFRVRWVGYADFAVAFPTDSLTIDFTDRSDVPDAASWSWDFGDGTDQQRAQSTAQVRPGRHVRHSSFRDRLSRDGGDEPEARHSRVGIGTPGAVLQLHRLEWPEPHGDGVEYRLRLGQRNASRGGLASLLRPLERSNPPSLQRDLSLHREDGESCPPPDRWSGRPGDAHR